MNVLYYVLGKRQNMGEVSRKNEIKHFRLSYRAYVGDTGGTVRRQDMADVDVNYFY